MSFAFIPSKTHCIELIWHKVIDCAEKWIKTPIDSLLKYLYS